MRYTVSVGKRVLARDLDRTSLRFRTKRLKDGRLDVKVTARDRLGQRVSSTEACLRLDRKPPRVSAAALGKRRVRIRIVDGKRPRVAGPARSRISFGDGKRGRGTRVVHSYKRPGVYKLVVTARDRAGNRKRRGGEGPNQVKRVATVLLLITAVLVLRCPLTPPISGARGARCPASPDRREQGDGPTTRVDLSDDGRFVAFETRGA